MNMSHQMHYMELVDDTQRVKRLLQRQSGSQNMNVEHSAVTLMSEYTDEITRTILELAQEVALHRQSKIVEPMDIQLAVDKIIGDSKSVAKNASFVPHRSRIDAQPLSDSIPSKRQKKA